MATFSKIDGAEPSTVTFSLASVTQDRGGVTAHQELVTMAGSESTLAVAQVRDGDPASTEWALAVRQVGLSTQALRVAQSSAADLNVTVAGYVAPSTTVSVSTGSVRVHQSSAADLNVTVAGYVAPSTTVTVSTGSVRVHQSSAADLNVTVAGYSTTVNVSSLAGTVTVAGNVSSNSSVYLPVRLSNGTAFLTPGTDYTDASTASNLAGPVLTFDNGSNTTMRAVSATLGLPVNVVAGSAAGDTTVSVTPLSSVATRWFPVQVSDGSTWISDSTNRAIRVNVVAGSVAGDTTVSVTPLSSNATRWFPVQVSDGSTWISDSTNRAIRVNVVASAASTTVNVSSVSGIVTIAGNQSSNSSVYLPVRFTNGTAFLAPGSDYADGSTASNVSGMVIVFDNGSNTTMRAVSTTLGLPVQVVAGTTNSVVPNSSVATRWFPVQVSDGSTWISDSTNRAIRVNVVAGSVAGDTTVSVTPLSSNATRWFPVQVSDGSTWISDSTNRAIRVNVVAGSVAGDTSVTVSTGSVRVHQSSAADLNVTVAGYSTTVNVSSLAGKVLVDQNSTVWQVQVSSISGVVAVNTLDDVNIADGGNSITVDDGGTTLTVDGTVIVEQATAASLNATVRVNTSSGGGVEGSTTTPAHGVLGIYTRPVCSSLQSTTVLITSTHSTALYDLVSSAAGVAHKVYAYFVSSTHTAPSTLVFMSSNSIDRFHVAFGSGSSGMSGANLAVSPLGGAFLFRTDAANALRCRIEGTSSLASTVVARISLSFFSE
jgi:autonomous glycyl radical cofactor GrcA